MKCEIILSVYSAFSGDKSCRCWVYDMRFRATLSSGSMWRMIKRHCYKYSSQSMRRLILLAQIGVWSIYQRRVVVHHSGPDDGSDLRSVGDGKEVSSTFTGREDFKSYIVFLAAFFSESSYFVFNLLDLPSPFTRTDFEEGFFITRLVVLYSIT